MNMSSYVAEVMSCVMSLFVCLFVHAGDARDAKATSQCNSVIWIIITLVILASLLSVIFLLILKMCQSKTGKKPEKGLWMEQMSLNTKPSVEE